MNGHQNDGGYDSILRNVDMSLVLVNHDGGSSVLNRRTRIQEDRLKRAPNRRPQGGPSRTGDKNNMLELQLQRVGIPNGWDQTVPKINSRCFCFELIYHLYFLHSNKSDKFFP